MKRIILIVLLFSLYQITYGQCEKNITFKCLKARSIKAGLIAQELPMDATISIENGRFLLSAAVNGVTETVEGEINEVVICDWQDFMKNGRTQYKALTKKSNEGPQNSIIDIESENGYTRITCSSDPDTGSKLQFDVAEYLILEDPAPINPGNTPKTKTTKKKKVKKSTGV